MNTNNATSSLTLVTGGTGKTGSRVATLLRNRGVEVRIGSRNADIPFDWDDRNTWAAALADVDAIYIAFQPDLAVPGAPETIRAFSAAARANGVRRLVLLSGRGEPEAAECEAMVQASGIAWTVLRCSWFSQNFSEGNFYDDIRAGTLALPAGDVPEPFIDADDIAEVAAAALTDQRHEGRIYELTGPRALTFGEAVAEIARATGRELTYVSISRTDFVAALTEYEVPADVIGLLDYLFGSVLDGRNSKPADGVRQALGRPARDFTEYARDVAASGIWNTEE